MKTLQDQVVPIVTQAGSLLMTEGGTHCNVLYDIRGNYDRDSTHVVVEELLEDAHQLLNDYSEPLKYSEDLPDSVREKFARDPYLKGYLADSEVKNLLSVAGVDGGLDGRYFEFFMEMLTAAWLGLYFLGVPFSHMWERVRRLADVARGFPRGVCVYKAYGDVYRTSRQVYIRDYQRQVNKDQSIITLAYSPIALFKEELIKPTPEITPHSFHVLGRCYLLLQLRLYIGEGLPIKYFVPSSVLPKKLDTKDKIKHSRKWMRQVFPLSCGDNQQLISVRDSGPVPCILGYKTGIYTLDSDEDVPSAVQMPFAGRRCNADLLRNLRIRLERLDSSEQLNKLTLPKFKKYVLDVPTNKS